MTHPIHQERWSAETTAAELGISKGHLLRDLSHRKDFPRRIQYKKGGKVYFLADDIRRWYRQQMGAA